MISRFVIDEDEKEFLEYFWRWKSGEFYGRNLFDHTQTCIFFHNIAHEFGHVLQIDHHFIGRRKAVNNLKAIDRNDFYKRD